MKINSRAKGNSFELRVSKILSDWWGLTFRRVPLSGGYDKKMVVGDLWIADKNATIEDIKYFPFSVEAKNREGWNWNILFGPGDHSLLGYWEQAKNDAAHLSKIPILIFKRNLSPLYIAWDESHIYSDSLRRTTVHDPKSKEILSIALLEEWLTIFSRQRVEYYFFSKRTALTI